MLKSLTQPSLYRSLCIALLSATLIPLLWQSSRADSDDDRDDVHATQAKPAQTATSGDTLTLSAVKQRAAGIKTQAIQRGQYQPEIQVSAQVMDLQNMLSVRETYFTALIEQQSAERALALSQQTLNRIQALFRNGVNSQRQLQEQELAHSTLQARVNSANYRLQSIEDTLTLTWGMPLSSWIKDKHSVELQRFIQGEQLMVLVSLSGSKSIAKGLSSIVVDRDGERQSPQNAQLIASAPHSSELSQGETYFFKTARGNLRTGMRLSAWIPNATQPLAGVIIPGSALLWHAGHAKVYIKIGAEQFQAVSIGQYFRVADGYFIAQALPETAEVVVTGAQLLLSYASHSLIPTEDNDGDD